MGFSLAIFFNYDFGFEKLSHLSLSKKETEMSNPISTPTPQDDTVFTSGIVELSEDFSLSLNFPLENKYLDNLFAPLIGGRDDSLYLAFFLDKGAEIRSIFKGKVVSIYNFKKGEFPFPNEPDFSQIWIENEDKSLRVGYTIIGDIFVKEDDSLEVGTILGIADEGELSLRGDTNFSLILAKKVAEKEYKVIGLKPEILLKVR